MKKKIGLILLLLAIIGLLTNNYLVTVEELSNQLVFGSIILIITSFILVIPFDMLPLIIFDNQEFEPNKSIESLVERIRFRGLLFNNLSVIIFIFTIIVIIVSFYLLVSPPLDTAVDNPNYLSTSLTIRISASILLIFLVQILFKAFKYLLRVASFYNAKADAIEYNKLDTNVGLEKLMELFTPDKYDISDLNNSSISNSLADILKSKLNK